MAACASRALGPAPSVPSPPELVLSASSVAMEERGVVLALVIKNQSKEPATFCMDPDQLLGLAVMDAKGATVEIVGATVSEGPNPCTDEHRLPSLESYAGKVELRVPLAARAAKGELTFRVPVTIGSRVSCCADIAVDFSTAGIVSQQTLWKCGRPDAGG